ncbi:MAG: hypothetical protein IJK15_09730 [Bacteroidaceae bacterium]|nr:hypothetical protein [Bacteroidaceae bacterium]
MEKDIPYPMSKDECFALLDKHLSASDKQEIAAAGDSALLHFSLGMWIRNTWLYPMPEDDLKTLMSDFKEVGNNSSWSNDFKLQFLCDFPMKCPQSSPRPI